IHLPSPTLPARTSGDFRTGSRESWLEFPAHEWLFRFGMAGDLVGAVVLIFLALAFYRLFQSVDQYLAVLVVILGGVMPSLIYFVNVVSDAGAMMIVRGADFLGVFDTPQRDALVMLLLRLHNHQNTAAELLWVPGCSRWRSSCTGRTSCRGFW